MNNNVQDNTVEKNKYSDLRDYLNLVLKQLNSCIEKLESASDVTKNNYTIDNVSNEKSKIDKNKNYLIKMRDDLRDIVIPQINQKVINLSQ